MSMSINGCSNPWGAAGLGAAGGAAAGVSSYEINAKKEMDRIKDDYDDGKITKEEYEIRKDQIERMAIFQR